MTPDYSTWSWNELTSTQMQLLVGTHSFECENACSVPLSYVEIVGIKIRVHLQYISREVLKLIFK